MTRKILSLFCVVFLFSQIDHVYGFCEDFNKQPEKVHYEYGVVRACQDDTATGPLIYIDSNGAPQDRIVNCPCTFRHNEGTEPYKVFVATIWNNEPGVEFEIGGVTFTRDSDQPAVNLTSGSQIMFKKKKLNDRAKVCNGLSAAPGFGDFTVTCTSNIIYPPSTDAPQPPTKHPTTSTPAPTQPARTTQRQASTKAPATTPEPPATTKKQATTTNKPPITTGGGKTETSHITTTILTKTEPTTDRITTDAESNTIGLSIALGVATGLVVVLSVTVVVLIFALRRIRNINRKPTEQPESATTYYNVANETGTYVASESSHNVNIQSSDMNPPATYESLQTHDQREDDHSYQTVIAGGDGEYVNADYEEPMTNDKSTNYTTIQQPIEQEHVYKTIH